MLISTKPELLDVPFGLCFRHHQNWRHPRSGDCLTAVVPQPSLSTTAVVPQPCEYTHIRMVAKATSWGQQFLLPLKLPRTKVFQSCLCCGSYVKLEHCGFNCDFSAYRLASLFRPRKNHAPYSGLGGDEQIKSNNSLLFTLFYIFR